MPYKGISKDIKIPEDVYYRYRILKGNNSNKETMMAMIESMELLKKILNTNSKDAVSITKKFKSMAKEEGLI